METWYISCCITILASRHQTTLFTTAMYFVKHQGQEGSSRLLGHLPGNHNDAQLWLSATVISMARKFSYSHCLSQITLSIAWSGTLKHRVTKAMRFSKLYELLMNSLSNHVVDVKPPCTDTQCSNWDIMATLKWAATSPPSKNSKKREDNCFVCSKPATEDVFEYCEGCQHSSCLVQPGKNLKSIFSIAHPRIYFNIPLDTF